MVRQLLDRRERRVVEGLDTHVRASVHNLEMAVWLHAQDIPGDTAHDQRGAAHNLHETVTKELGWYHLPDDPSIWLVSGKPGMPVLLRRGLHRLVSDHARNHATRRLPTGVTVRSRSPQSDPEPDEWQGILAAIWQAEGALIQSKRMWRTSVTYRRSCAFSGPSVFGAIGRQAEMRVVDQYVAVYAL
jgi:hypothetical protein